MRSLSNLASWRAKPLHAAAKQDKFRQVMDLRAESVLLGRSAILAGWTLFVVGVACLVASMAGWIIFLPLKTVDVKFLAVDRSTGIVSEPVSIKDAPTLFSEATDHHYLKEFILACEQWQPQMDAQNWRKCQLMSAPEQQARYAAWRDSPMSPPKALGKGGYVQIENFRYFRQATEKASGPRRYMVRFDRTVWRGSIKDATQVWSATVDFVWHPELSMTPRDRDDNVAGMQVVGYSASSDSNAGELPK